MVFLLACAPSIPEQEEFPFARAHRECGPADGPAIRIQLSTREMPLTLREQPVGSYLDLLVNASMTDASGRRFLVDPEGRGRSGSSHAYRCNGASDCTPFRSGTVRLDRLQGDSLLTGRYQLEVGNGRRMVGRFRALWIEVPLLCG
jgi:hypothetical protein